MIKYFKNLLTSFIIWFKPPKIGHINIDPLQSSLQQDARDEQQRLEVNLKEWSDTIESVFGTDNFVTEGIERPIRPNDEILKHQIQLFWKDYRKLNQKVDQLYTKTVNLKHYHDIDNS